MKKLPCLLLAICSLASAYAGVSDLSTQFLKPPDSARPWVYYFPLDGNLSREGITADLEAMKRAGIGGLLYMETAQGTPTGPAAFGGPEWRDLIKHLCSEAARLGLQINMNNDAGWCGSGGPWITPELSMQKVVWSETEADGPAHFESNLPQPKAGKDFYRDIAVLAFPTPPTGRFISQLAAKSGVARTEIPPRASYPELPGENIVPRDQILDLTGKLGKDGRLSWDVPEGKWTILRFGHTTTGKDNHPAPEAGRGLESDKLSKEATKVHFDGLMRNIIDDSAPLAGKALISTHIDSWETGSQNWTPKFREEFLRLRGYDPLPLLPVLAGRIVGSPEISERFLWDMRMTAGDLLNENYAEYLAGLAHKHGMRLSIEAYGNGPFDDIRYAGCADEPMAEFWWPAQANLHPSCLEMASAAHVYGRPILGAEAFTATNEERWLGHPALLKALGDRAFCEGINRFVFHRYAAQPWTNPDRSPGIGMGPWGQHYERTQTWWDQSKAWHDYLARCQFLLQKGLPVADLCFLEAETSPQAFDSPEKSGSPKTGYRFDGCPPEALLSRMKVKDGRLALPDGLSYRMLVLPQVETMTPTLLRKIRDLVRDGATVLGMPPSKSPSLQDYPRCDEEVRSLARELWGEGAPPAELTARPFGKGFVIWGCELAAGPPPPYEMDSSPNFLSKAKWIWFDDGRKELSMPPGTRQFRRIVDMDAGVDTARILMTADNRFTLWVNGVLIGTGDNHKQATGFNIGDKLKPGRNTIAVLAENTTDEPSPAGLLGAVKIQYRDGQVREIFTDSSWEAANSLPEGWQTDSRPGTQWTKARELGAWGTPPWGEVGEVPPRGRGPKVDTTPDIAAAARELGKLGVPPDFGPASKLGFIHKKLGDADVYFVANPEPQEVETVCTFRVSGKHPELWHPDTGRINPAATFEEKEGLTSIPVKLDAGGSLFVVFREKKSHAPAVSNWNEYRTVQEITGPWKVAFDPRWGGPEQPVEFSSLQDWSKRPEDGIRFYSGTAVYSKTINIPSDLAGKPLFLDLGKVAVMAEVSLNGRDLGIAWKPPFRVDITDAAKAGDNALAIKVVNLWVNRLIGDEQLPEDSPRKANGTLAEWPQWVKDGKPSPTGRLTFTSHRLWKKDDPLQASGLLGPVSLQAPVNENPH